MTARLARAMGAGIPHIVNDGKILPKSEDVATGAWIEYQKLVLGEDVTYVHDPRYADGTIIPHCSDAQALVPRTKHLPGANVACRFTFDGRCRDSDIVTHYVEHPEQACLHKQGACSMCFPRSRL